jgi:rubrerythrin
MDILKFLKEVEELEGRLAEAYGRFSRDLDNAEVSDMFRKLSQDEESHRDIVVFEKKMVMRNRGEFKDVEVDVSGLPEMLAVIDGVMKSAESLSSDDAIKFAVNCEKSAAEIHFKKAITIANPQIAGLMKSLGQKDKDHFSFLSKIARDRGIPAEFIPEQIIVPRIRKEKIRIK